jgi:hypothetical protein
MYRKKVGEGDGPKSAKKGKEKEKQKKGDQTKNGPIYVF